MEQRLVAGATRRGGGALRARAPDGTRTGEGGALRAEEATAGVAGVDSGERRSDELRALRKGLGYCWSVAVAAAPNTGRPRFEDLVERAAASGDRDLRWIARENLRKRRLERLDADWVAALRARLG